MTPQRPAIEAKHIPRQPGDSITHYWDYSWATTKPPGVLLDDLLEQGAEVVQPHGWPDEPSKYVFRVRLLKPRPRAHIELLEWSGPPTGRYRTCPACRAPEDMHAARHYLGCEVARLLGRETS